MTHLVPICLTPIQSYTDKMLDIFGILYAFNSFLEVMGDIMPYKPYPESCVRF